MITNVTYATDPIAIVGIILRQLRIHKRDKLLKQIFIYLDQGHDFSAIFNSVQSSAMILFRLIFLLVVALISGIILVSFSIFTLVECYESVQN